MWFVIAVLYVAIILFILAIGIVWSENTHLFEQQKRDNFRMDQLENIQDDLLQKYIALNEILKGKRDKK